MEGTDQISLHMIFFLYALAPDPTAFASPPGSNGSRAIGSVATSLPSSSCLTELPAPLPLWPNFGDAP